MKEVLLEEFEYIGPRTHFSKKKPPSNCSIGLHPNIRLVYIFSLNLQLMIFSKERGGGGRRGVALCTKRVMWG